MLHRENSEKWGAEGEEAWFNRVKSEKQEEKVEKVEKVEKMEKEEKVEKLKQQRWTEWLAHLVFLPLLSRLLWDKKEEKKPSSGGRGAADQLQKKG